MIFIINGWKHRSFNMILESLNNWEMSAKIYYQRNIFINVKTCTYIIKIIIEKAGVVIISLFLNFSRVFEYASVTIAYYKVLWNLCDTTSNLIIYEDLATYFKDEMKINMKSRTLKYLDSHKIHKPQIKITQERNTIFNQILFRTKNKNFRENDFFSAGRNLK